MNRTRLRLTVAGLSLAALGAVVPLAASPASATSFNTNIVVKATDSNGVQFAGGTSASKLSSDGDWLGFSRLTGNGSYLKSLVSGATQLVSLNDADQPANAPSTVLGVYHDGSRVLFSTAATNMNQTAPTALDLYVRNLSTGRTQRVNLIDNGSNVVPAAVKPGEDVLSNTNDYVVFTTTTNHVWARNYSSGAIFQVDLNSGQVPGNSGAGQPSVNDDGYRISFTSSSTNLSANDNNFASDVFVRDMDANTTTRVSLTDADLAPNGPSSHSSISDDGLAVAFSSDGNNLVTGDTNSSTDVFVRYLTSGSTYRASLASGGAQASGTSKNPSLNGTGTHVAFESTAANLDTNQNNGLSDVFLRDISGNLTTQESFNGSTGPNLSGAFNADLADGNLAVAFTSPGSNLVDGDTNGAGDAFVRRYETRGPYAAGVGDMVAGLASEFGVDTGYDTAIDDLYNGRLTSGHFLLLLAHDQRWAKDRAPVARLYQAFFHREPDLGGLNYWIKKRKAGTKLGVIAANFAGSSEFKTAYGKLNDHDFVDLVYGNVLQRKPDTAGLNHWVAKLAGGMSRGDMMVAFSESSEGQRVLGPEVDATLIGLAMFKAMPPKTLWLKSAADARSHSMAEWGALAYLNSNEYAALH